MSPKKSILIDIGHPAHVHLFRCFIGEMESRGHKVFVPVSYTHLDVYKRQPFYNAYTYPRTLQCRELAT